MGRGQGLDELLRVVQRCGQPGETLEWLRRWTGAEVAWIDGGALGNGVVAATPGFPGVVEALQAQVERLADGRLAAATTRVGDLEVRLEAFGRREPRSVLVTASAAALSREAAALVSQAGGLLQLLGEASRADDSARGDEDKARALRFAVLTALMTGDVTLARRMTSWDVPPLLGAERVRVHLLHCPPADRDRLARTFQDASGYHGHGLMVHCPAFEEHLICPIAEATENAAPDDRLDRLEHGQVLRRLVRENPGYALGVSRPHPLTALAEAYGEALHALAVARNSPDRLAAYRGRPLLIDVLPRPAATAWARAHVAPLHAEPKLTQDITRLAVTFPRTAVAGLLRVSRTTVVAHCGRAERALGLDLGDVRARAELDLALALTDLPPDPAAVPRQVPPTLAELLHTAPAITWAATFLQPLRDVRHRDLEATVRAWIDHNTDAQRTAEALALSRNTIRARLRTAERLLNRDLLTTASGIHDVVHAIAVTGHRAHSGDGSGHRARWSKSDTAA
ncbi:helix-turn-helix domain-containing protein [Streptomyces sp. NL15-2K]|uniref:helix-turn-helix domain-containing protein n=1 Tax=Streptomyces sp. NL15-2K TaxID=376149 RepID=UPI000F586223|nr:MULTISPECIES: PucR family transcriptional regulator [Actinomycetes]WKX11606.1 helix-turn-helix domain-containing protein [Kutzneria buriramensis]